EPLQVPAGPHRSGTMPSPPPPKEVDIAIDLPRAVTPEHGCSHGRGPAHPRVFRRCARSLGPEPDPQWTSAGWTRLLTLPVVDAPTSLTSKGSAAVYAANPTAATNPRQMLPMLNITRCPIESSPSRLPPSLSRLTTANAPRARPFHRGNGRRSDRIDPPNVG